MMDPRTSAQDMMQCDLCETAVVQMHCDTCLVNLCKACVGNHISTDECKDHKVVTFQFRKSTHGSSVKTKQKSHEASSTPVIKQLLNEPQTVTTIHTGYGNLYNVACLSDEEIWTQGDDTIKLFSISQDSLLRSVTTKSGYTADDLAVTNSGDLVYTDYRDKSVNIVKNEEIQTVIRVKGWIPLYVCSTSSDDLLVIMVSDDFKQSKVVSYSNFTEKQSIQFDDQGRPLHSSGYHKYISENRNLDICVADYEAKAVVVRSIRPGD
ncbi:uncharacterized protein LOC125670418 isoform X1 [Ostrea edulis]|nr:uncharacterized protein LOC125670418 isoform X1 [Ostrea edulis]XP_048761526.2 uncharacterized protein LOC125670418 isoform X1 [Ostrea edulis]